MSGYPTGLIIFGPSGIKIRPTLVVEVRVFMARTHLVQIYGRLPSHLGPGSYRVIAGDYLARQVGHPPQGEATRINNPSPHHVGNPVCP